MKFLSQLRKHWRAGIATIVASATLAGGMTAAFAGVGTGTSTGDGLTIIGNGGVQYGWYYKESYGGLNDDTVRHFFDEKGFRRGGGSDALISHAVNQARDSIKARSGGQLRNPRIVGIAVMLWDKPDNGGLEFNNNTKDGDLSVQDWKNAYHSLVDGHDFTSSSTHTVYRTSQRWSNGRSIDSFADEMMDHMDPHSTELMIIALNEDEPQTSYHVDVSTNAHPGNMYLRNNEPVYDTVHTRVTKGQWPNGNRLGATVWLNYEPGHGASAQPGKAVRHDFTIDHVGDTNTPEFRPSDFGWQHGWAIGTYWFDITIDKQNNMDSGINTPDRQQSETMVLTNYGLNATTGAIKANAAVDNTEPVHDVVDVKEIKEHIPTGVTLKAKSILHFDGNKNVPAAQAEKEFTFTQAGSITSPEFTPADLKFTEPHTHGWAAGNYWFDLQIPKQDDMEAAVDLTDRQPEESFVLPEEPGKLTDKEVEKPVSASLMKNQTTITFNTGKGGYELQVVDKINPNDNKVSVDNIHMEDVTAKKNVDNLYNLSYDAASQTVTATWKDPTVELPSAHDMKWTFDVQVDHPNMQNVQDTPTLTWNQTHTLTGDTHEFRTWKPTPDKSWIRQDEKTGKWQAVIDPDWSNGTGADKHVFMDGDPVASVVNGVVRSDLIQNMDTFTLTDDYANASYIFQPAALSQYRVYSADASEDVKSSVADIVNTGTDITNQFTISQKGTKVTATAKPEFLLQTKGREKPLQVTLLIPGQIALAHGHGAAQMRQDMGLKPGDEINTCVLPATEKNKGEQFTNTGMETVNNADYNTNVPYICVYAPEVKKQVRAEASQGGDQSDINLKTVFPGQKVEYVLQTKPDFSKAGDGYTVKNVKFIDHYDEYLTPDKQTVEMQNLSNGSMVSRKHYKTVFDEKKHMFTLTVTDDALIADWVKQGAPQLQVRFEGRVSKDIPGKKKVNNQWVFQLRNSLTPSNIVENKQNPPEPHKGDEQHPAQGDPSINIDGKTLLLGDKGQYDILLDALSIKDPAYKVYRLGIVDSYNTKYLKIDEKDLKVTDETGTDVSDKFNLKIIDGTVYAFAKLVDTEIPATGETVKAVQPKDLKAYAMSESYNPLTDPAIDQSLLGHTYHVLLPYTVIKVDPNTVVENTALQITNDLHGQTNTVKNPLKDLNPSKDVVIKVGDKSINNQAVYKNHYFLYQLNSSLLPADRAYEKVTDWTITDPLPAEFDQFTGQYALYAASDLYDGDTVLVKKGGKLAGSTFTPNDALKALLDKNGETQLFSLTKSEPETLTFTAGKTLLNLLSQNKHEFSWTVYVQVKRLKPAEQVVNQFTETLNGKPLKSNKVVTRTPDQTPAITVEKYDVASGLKLGDRNNPKQALENAVDGTKIGFLITNTGNTPLSNITLSDKTVAGSGTVKDIDLTPLKNKTLQPGEQVTVYGTLHGVEANGYHTDRATVTGTPRLVCPVNPDSLPDDSTKPETKPETGKAEGSALDKAVAQGAGKVAPGYDRIPEKPADHITYDKNGNPQVSLIPPYRPDMPADKTTADKPAADGDKTTAEDGQPASLPTPGADGLCAGTNITATDDWNGKRPQLASTGAGVTVIVIAAAVLLVAGGAGVILARRRK